MTEYNDPTYDAQQSRVADYNFGDNSGKGAAKSLSDPGITFALMAIDGVFFLEFNDTVVGRYISIY